MAGVLHALKIYMPYSGEGAQIPDLASDPFFLSTRHEQLLLNPQQSNKKVWVWNIR